MSFQQNKFVYVHAVFNDEQVCNRISLFRSKSEKNEMKESKKFYITVAVYKEAISEF